MCLSIWPELIVTILIYPSFVLATFSYVEQLELNFVIAAILQDPADCMFVILKGDVEVSSLEAIHQRYPFGTFPFKQSGN
jgi:hypothetical protein